MPRAVPGTSEMDELITVTDLMRAGIDRVVTGRPELVRTTVAVLLAEGHLLLEDVPGVGKTTLAKALARTIDCTVGRVQFTPDLLPSDLTGVTIYRAATQDFEFRPGPVFSHVVIGDEINRASPKTQSALLESMQESQVTVDGTTYPLPRPFLVLATQNPVEMEGTYPLPEAQRDRFMARLTVGYPSQEAELAMLDLQETSDPLDHLSPVTDAAQVARLIEITRHLYASPAVKQYVVDLVSGTREDPALRLGASPRAAIQLLRAAKGYAAVAGRDHVLPDDVQQLAEPVLAHRVILSAESRLSGRTGQDVIGDLVVRTAVPAPARTAVRDRTAAG